MWNINNAAGIVSWKHYVLVVSLEQASCDDTFGHENLCGNTNKWVTSLRLQIQSMHFRTLQCLYYFFNYGTFFKLRVGQI
jgi:hypothetical protein